MKIQIDGAKFGAKKKYNHEWLSKDVKHLYWEIVRLN